MTKQSSTGIEISDIDIKKVEGALVCLKNENAKNENALENYTNLMNGFHKEKGSSDAEFRKDYKGFFNVRRDEDFSAVYFEFMEEHKNDDKKLTFEEILRYLYDKVKVKVKRVEFSYSSKLLSVINPDMPVWDKFVRENLKMSVISGNTPEKRMEKAVTTYSCLCEKYKNFFGRDKAIADKWIKLFDKHFPPAEYYYFVQEKKKGLTQVKKIDLILWQIR